MMMRDISFSLLIILLLNSCSLSQEENASGETVLPDTSYYIPEDGTSPLIAGGINVDTIEISDMKFQPQEIRVHKGDTVIWINHDLVSHCVTEESNKAWTSSLIPAGGSWKMVVTEGSGYYCAIHLVMKGRIVVESDPLSSLQ